jgi:hypothetical protein
MKQTSSILLVLLYLLTSVGLTVNVHYCGGKLKSIQLLFDAPSCCCGETKKMDGCCEDESFFVQLDTDHQFSPIQKLSFEMPIILNEMMISENIEQINSQDNNWNIPLKRPPPGSSLRLLYCSLTYYG